MKARELKRLLNRFNICKEDVIICDDDGNWIGSKMNNLYKYMCSMSKRGNSKFNSFHLCSGASKLVFTFGDKANYVYKMNFNRIGYYYDDEPKYDDINFDYCEEEVNVYESIPEMFKPLFAKEKVAFCLADGTKVYQQDSVKYSWDNYEYKSEISRDSIELAENINTSRLASNFIALIIDENGYDFACKFIDFLDSTDLGIQIDADMHYGNYGVDACGLPKIFDYSGYGLE